MVGEHGRIFADAGQEGGIQFRQPLQAEEIQAGNSRDSVVVDRVAFGIDDGKIDPAEIDAVAGGPDHRGDAFRSEVEPLQGRGDAGRVGKGCPRAGLFGQLQAAAFYILINDIEEGDEGEVAVGEAIGKAGCNLDDAVLGCLEMSDQDHAVGGEAAEIDGAAAIGAGNDGAEPRRARVVPA